ncbi:MAG TPA: peptidogalycan biosysnthesis protein, partial [Afipia sp.]
MNSSDITLEAVPSASQITADEWDACANPRRKPAADDELAAIVSCVTTGDSRIDSTSSYNPFISHAFFTALEESGSASARTGWLPRHLVARRNGAVIGLVPCYAKNHSQGEYVFDHGWADAFERAGGNYYPKLQA